MATPSVPQSSAIYTVTGGDGSGEVAVINDQASANYVGSFGEEGITGLDSPDIREAAWNLVEDDGGVHGNFFFGRRPITLNLEVLGTTTTLRNQRLQKLKVATRALRSDGLLQWTPDGGVAQRINFRTQQSFRVSGGWKKDAFVGLVAADPLIYSEAQPVVTLTAGVSSSIPNDGDFPAPAVIRINGPGTNPRFFNNGTGITTVRFPTTTLAAGAWIDVDLKNHTAFDNLGASRYGEIEFSTATWQLFAPGLGAGWRISWASGNTGASTAVVTYRHAWA